MAVLEKAMAPHSSTLAWKIPWMEEPGGLQSMGSLRLGHDWATSLSLFTFMHCRRKRQPTPVFLPGESQGWWSLVGCRLWGSHRVRHDWSDLAVAIAMAVYLVNMKGLSFSPLCLEQFSGPCFRAVFFHPWSDLCPFFLASHYSPLAIAMGGHYLSNPFRNLATDFINSNLSRILSLLARSTAFE